MALAWAFQPLYPDERTAGELVERAAALISESHRLGATPGTVALAVAPLLRAMLSYYTNRIESQHTRPADIERALARQYDADEKQARRQRLAVAHMGAEAALETAVMTLSRPAIYDAGLVARIHCELYSSLPEGDRVTDEGAVIVPGAWRTVDVPAGRHVAPRAADIVPLLGAWHERYAALPGIEQAVVGVACSHHRLLWIHPFVDGNGRVARLHTHLALTALGLTHGLWSPLRGIARDVESYYARLNNADLPRRNDLDGRGPLSQEELVAFSGWLLDVCLDQVRFMRRLLALDALKARIADLLGWLAANPWRMGSEMSTVKADATEALHYAAIAGPVERGRFMAMTGLPPRTARRLLSSLLDYGVLATVTSRAPVRFAVPQKSLRLLLPHLWPEAEADLDPPRAP